MSAQPEIFFHVGLGKVASTYLQYRFFPKLEGIRYIQCTRYKRSIEIIASEKRNKYLISREFDRQLQSEAQWFSAYHPQARPILLLRRQDSWAASQYRRHVKNGIHVPFEGFIDIEHNKGLWDRSELEFYTKIEQLEKCFQHKPLVLFYDDLLADPWAFFDQLARYMGASYPREKISLKPKHKSYSEKQLKIIREWNKTVYAKPRAASSSPVLTRLRRMGEKLYRYPALYLAGIAPSSRVPDEPLIDKMSLQAVRDAYAADWEKCLEYARLNNPATLAKT